MAEVIGEVEPVKKVMAIADKKYSNRKSLEDEEKELEELIQQQSDETEAVERQAQEEADARLAEVQAAEAKKAAEDLTSFNANNALTTQTPREAAKQAALLRFTAKSYNENNIADVVDIDDLLNVERKEDAGNGLWEVFNRVQESLVNGKYSYAMNGKVNAADSKTRKARPIKNFKQSIDVNKKLSELAFALV